MSRQPLRLAVVAAAKDLDAAGVASPRVDAELLAAHVMGVERSRLPLVPLIDDEPLAVYRELVAERVRRVPLHHILGWAAMGQIVVAVGPGVFTPRPETDLLLDWALTAVRDTPAPRVADLCTGSGAVALAFAHARPDAEVHAVESDSTALAWARRNSEVRREAGDTPVRLHRGDATDRRVLAAWEGEFDVVLSNPPYVPDATEVPPEVAEHDPAVAVFAGPDGLDVIRPLVATIASRLRVGGVVGIEHDESHAPQVAELFRARRVYDDVTTHDDLAGRPRFTTARRVGAAR